MNPAASSFSSSAQLDPTPDAAAEFLAAWPERRLRVQMRWAIASLVLAPALAIGLVRVAQFLPEVNRAWDRMEGLVAGFIMGATVASARLAYVLRVRREWCRLLSGTRVLLGSPFPPWLGPALLRAGLVALPLLSLHAPSVALLAILWGVFIVLIWWGAFIVLQCLLLLFSSLRMIGWVLGLFCAVVAVSIGATLRPKPEEWFVATSVGLGVTLLIGLAAWWRLESSTVGQRT